MNRAATIPGAWGSRAFPFPKRDALQATQQTHHHNALVGTCTKSDTPQAIWPTDLLNALAETGTEGGTQRAMRQTNLLRALVRQRSSIDAAGHLERNRHGSKACLLGRSFIKDRGGVSARDGRDRRCGLFEEVCILDQFGS